MDSKTLHSSKTLKSQESNLCKAKWNRNLWKARWNLIWNTMEGEGKDVEDQNLAGFSQATEIGTFD
jgi:hypothetical protein